MQTARSIWSTVIKCFSDDNMSAHYLEPWPINQSWQYWDGFETKDTKRCILVHFERCFWKLKMLRKLWNQGWYMVHSGAISNDVLEVGTAEKILKTRKLDGAFWRYSKRCFGSWNCWEKFESTEAKWCIRVLFKECGWRVSGELLNVEICSSLK